MLTPRFSLLVLLLCGAGTVAAQQPAKRPAPTKTTKTTATPRQAATGDATVAPGETVELGRASTDYNGRPSTYKKPARKPLPTDAATLPGGQGSYAAPGQPVQPAERARDDYDGRPVPARKPAAKSTTLSKPAKN
jgi:hypothetical protein